MGKGEGEREGKILLQDKISANGHFNFMSQQTKNPYIDSCLKPFYIQWRHLFTTATDFLLLPREPVSACSDTSNRPLPFHLHLHEIPKFLDSET